MKNMNNMLAIGIAVSFEIVLIVTAAISIESGAWKNLFLSLLAIACLIIPFVITYICSIKKIVLPPGFNFTALVFIFSAQYFGELKKFYIIFWWWDLFLHAVFGSYGAITALFLIQGIIEKGQEATKRRFILFTSLFAFSFSIALGTLWEVFEFVGDYIFKTKMVKGGLEDTETDLLVKIAAAFITVIVYYNRNKADTK